PMRALSIVLTAWVTSSVSAQHSNAVQEVLNSPEPGTGYVLLERPAQPQAEMYAQLLQFFWYGCPHCYRFEAYMEPFREKLDESSVSVERVPVVWNEVTRLHATAYYTARSL